MGDFNQLAYLKHWVPTVEGAVLEIGSRDYGSTSKFSGATTSFRDFYAGSEYVGLDMSEGKDVDVVVDLTKGVGSLPENHFDLGICCSVLEHVEKPWLFAENLTRLIRPGGNLYMSVPWVWRYHAYPDDYFRFSHRGVMSLFGEFTWTNVFYSSNTEGEFIAITDAEIGEDSKMLVKIDNGRGQIRNYLPYLMVNMLGTRRAGT